MISKTSTKKTNHKKIRRSQEDAWRESMAWRAAEMMAERDSVAGAKKLFYTQHTVRSQGGSESAATKVGAPSRA